MTFGGILLLALGLSMDAMAVAAARGFSTPRIAARHVLLVAGFFGGFQALMPLIGYLIGSHAGQHLTRVGPWVVFVVLGGIGAKMLWEARHPEIESAPVQDAFGLRVLLLLAIATSIDALAAGFTLPLLGAPLGLSLVTIFATTALLSALGLFAGHRFGAALGSRLDALGGLILIGIGLKTLLEHLGVV